MTAQFPENLIYNGETLPMFSILPLPIGHPRLVRREEKEAMRDFPLVFSTGCWRNYIGTWEISKGRLYLLKLEGIWKLEGNTPLFADWVSTTLVVPRGKLLKYVHMGFESIYERTLYIEVRAGEVSKTWEVDNRSHRSNPPALR